GRDPGAPARGAREPQPPHQAMHAAPPHGNLLASQLPPDLPRPVDLMVIVPDALNLGAQRVIPLRARRATGGIGLLRLVEEVRRWGDRQLRTDRLDPIVLSMLVHEGHHHFGRRSSSAWAKYADAFRRISLARFKSTTSRSSTFNRCRSSVVRPGRFPPSCSA